MRRLVSPTRLTGSGTVKTYQCYLLQGQDDGTSCLSVQEYLETRDGERPLGVYALYDEHSDVQYVGYSRNMVIAVKVTHAVICQGVHHSL